MMNRFRLKSDKMFTRTEELNQESPLRIVFLAVEGNVTESYYLKWIEKYRDTLKINTKVHVHSLGRAKSDHLSAPNQVLELLEEYLEIRNTDILPEKMKAMIPEKFSDDFVKKYLEHPNEVDHDQCKEFETLLQQAGLDLQYAYYLKEYSGTYDRFGIVVDRDHHSHTVSQLNDIWKECEKNNYEFYITTPCIEFWLLAHLVNIHDAYKDELCSFRDNPKLSKRHSFTSKKVSEKAGHSKKIEEAVFIEYYLKKVDFAIDQIKNSFTTDVSKLIGSDESEDSKKGELGSNLPELFKLLRENPEDYLW